MAATVAASKVYDLSGGALKEDLGDIIYDISPMETFFMSNISRGTAKSTTHEWLTDALPSPSAKNAKIEGDDFTAVARTLPSRLKNYCQISRVDYEVTGTAQKVDNAGMRELLAYHTAKAGQQIKRDIESGLLAAEPASAGSSVSARVSGGAEMWIYQGNHIKGSSQTTATTSAPTAGFAVGPAVSGTATAFTLANLTSMLSQSWSCGGEVDTILCGATLYNSISQFTGIATRFRDVAAGRQASIVNAADVFVSAFGRHNIQLSRYSTISTVFALDLKTWGVDYLRPFQTVDIAKIGDAERRMILAEYTLRCTAPLANCKATGMTS